MKESITSSGRLTLLFSRKKSSARKQNREAVSCLPFGKTHRLKVEKTVGQNRQVLYR